MKKKQEYIVTDTMPKFCRNGKGDQRRKENFKTIQDNWDDIVWDSTTKKQPKEKAITQSKGKS